MIDCICRAFLPRCEPDACDDRVEIACFSVKQGKILDICNHSCRRYAGAFPSTFYWMSLIPLVPLIGRMLAMLCCQPALLRRNSPLVNDLLPLLAMVDPTGKLGRAVTEDNFALPRRYLTLAAKFSDTPVLPALAARLNRAGEKDRTKVRGQTGGGADDVTALRGELAELKLQVAALAAAPRGPG